MTRLRLKQLLCDKSLKFGSFKLSSGGLSDFYLDARLTTCSAEAMPLIGKLFIQQFSQYDWNPSVVGGLTMGADPIAFSIARERLDSSSENKIDAFVIRKQQKTHGMGQLLEGIANPLGKKVVILDDVCSTGDSIALAIEHAISNGMEVLGACCLVDREMGAVELVKNKFQCELTQIFTISELKQFTSVDNERSL